MAVKRLWRLHGTEAQIQSGSEQRVCGPRIVARHGRLDARHAFAYVFAGSGKFCNASGPLSVPTESVGWLDTAPPKDASDRSLVLFDRGDEVVVQAGADGIRFLLVSGKPLQEPVAWYGPIVMNTQEQLREAFSELQKGTFLRSDKTR